VCERVAVSYAQLVSEIQSAQITIFYLFDVAETVDLQAIPTLIAGATVPARLVPKPQTPPYVQYDKPPLSFEGESVGFGEVEGFRVRFRLYDYGVISIALTRPFTGDWSELVRLGQALIENDELESRADTLCRAIADRLRPALVGYRDTHLREDYLVYAIHELDHPCPAEHLVEFHGTEVAAMLRGERQALSADEQEKVLSHRISYLSDDLVVATWNAALVYDTPAGIQAALEIIEYANSQLLEFRYYDERLEVELASIYASLHHPRWYDQWVGSRYTRAARKVHALFIEVNEVTGRTENALKFTGDIYAARLFKLVADRFGLDTWKADVEGKLQTVDAIYRFAVEQSSMARGQLLELAIVLILVFELLLFFVGVME
jgi:hypothetical protein